MAAYLNIKKNMLPSPEIHYNRRDKERYREPYQFLGRLKLVTSSTFHILHHQALEDSSKDPCMHAQKLCFYSNQNY